jgi:hypothetical protein
MCPPKRGADAAHSQGVARPTGARLLVFSAARGSRAPWGTCGPGIDHAKGSDVWIWPWGSKRAGGCRRVRPLISGSHRGGGMGGWPRVTEREIPIAEIREPPVYQRFAMKAARLREFGMNLGVDR